MFMPLLLPHFCTYILIQTPVSFLEEGLKNISCSRAQGTLATPLVNRRSNSHTHFLPQNPTILLLPTDIALSSAFLALNVICHLKRKITEVA